MILRMTKTALGAGVLVFTIVAVGVAAQDPEAARRAVIARGKSLELPTKYVPPPGDVQAHHAGGYAKVMCSAVFITGLVPDFARENVGFFTGPYEERAKVAKPVIDRSAKAVHVTLPNGVKRTARYLGDQGCVTLPIGKDTVDFKPVSVKSRLPDPATRPWPTGDVLPKDPPPAGLDVAKVKQALNAAFEPSSAMTAPASPPRTS